MKNFHEQPRHCFKPPPIRFHERLPHFGHTIFGNVCRYIQPATKAAPASMAFTREAFHIC